MIGIGRDDSVAVLGVSVLGSLVRSGEGSEALHGRGPDMSEKDQKVNLLLLG